MLEGRTMIRYRLNFECVAALRYSLVHQPIYVRNGGFMQDAENIQPDKLLTDRSTYIGYLESQLERVTNACLTVQSFDQRVETVTSAVRLLEEKVCDCTMLLPLAHLTGNHIQLCLHMSGPYQLSYVT